MSNDPTAYKRVSRYEAKMISKGMVRTHVWVPTEAHAAEIKRIAAEMREQEQPRTSAAEIRRIAAKIRQQAQLLAEDDPLIT